MNEKQAKQFVKLLQVFIDSCGLDMVDACNKAGELLTIINEQ